MDISYVCLLLWSYRHRSHVSERVQRECRYCRYGKGVGEIVTIARVIYYIAPLHLAVIDVVYSLIDSSISLFGVYVSNGCVCDLVHKCVYLDRVC